MYVIGDRERGDEHARADAAPEEERDHDREQQRREREHRVHEQHRAAVERAAEVPGDQSEGHADDEAEGEREPDDLQLGLGAPDDAGENVGRLHRRPEEVRVRRVRELRESMAARLVLVEPIRREDRREDRKQDEDERQPGAGPEHAPCHACAPRRSAPARA